ncbi:jerky protein homolog-like [Uloborus diversus]|uniref:jerky protein homolog-like n=1 Tax=Uloborus diversus TaxID=327109 RepID=UPI0024092598|nr:jerky protein homolog-like [Uloborus diversus]
MKPFLLPSTAPQFVDSHPCLRGQPKFLPSSKYEILLDASLGTENEKRLASYVKRLANAGFPLDRSTIRSLAYQFAEKLGIQHTFSKEKEKAGQHWLFLERNKDVSVRQAEGLPVARAQGMNREVGAFFKLLEEEMVKHDLTNRPENIFNVDETGIQLINKPGKILTAKGAKDVHVITPREKGETISLVACCSAEGRFLPPVLIMKGVNKKAEFSDGLPNGSVDYMNKKSSYINAVLFLRWFKEHFLPKKPKTGKTILILDGHTSHSNSIDLLDIANENDVIILCLPSHTTQAL